LDSSLWGIRSRQEEHYSHVKFVHAAVDVVEAHCDVIMADQVVLELVHLVAADEIFKETAHPRRSHLLLKISSDGW
jgi:hypothetical protein